MAMPKKGLRKIIVDGKEYRYKTKPRVKLGPESNGGRLTIEFGRAFIQRDFEEAITPSMVAEFLKDFLNK
jgi:hypothetical protein